MVLYFEWLCGRVITRNARMFPETEMCISSCDKRVYFWVSLIRDVARKWSTSRWKKLRQSCWNCGVLIFMENCSTVILERFLCTLRGKSRNEQKGSISFRNVWNWMWINYLQKHIIIYYSQNTYLLLSTVFWCYELLLSFKPAFSYIASVAQSFRHCALFCGVPGSNPECFRLFLPNWEFEKNYIILINHYTDGTGLYLFTFLSLDLNFFAKKMFTFYEKYSELNLRCI